MGSILRWLLSGIPQTVCWGHTTRTNRRDDPITARYEMTNRRAGYAVAAFGLSAALLAAGVPPYRGFSYLVHCVDQLFAGLCRGASILAGVLTYLAWAFDQDREA